MKRISYKKTWLIGMVVLSGSLFSTPEIALASLNPFSLDNIAYEAVSGLFAYALTLLQTLAGQAVAFLAILLREALFIAIKTTEYTFVYKIWEISRNFVNMLFILAMVTMAYGTILKLWPNYTIQKMLPQVLVVAILMNFSFAITKVGIKTFDNIGTTILAGTQDAMERIGPALSIETFTKFSGDTLRNTEDIFKKFFGTILFSFVAISFLIALIFLIIRTPILWILIISSPIALFAYLIPSLKKKIWDRWVSEFIKWNTFLPIFLLSLYVGLYVLAQQGEIVKITGNPNDGLLGFGIGVVFFYLLVGFIFLGGTAAAISGGIVAGSGAVWGATKAKQMTYDALGITGAQRAWQAKVKEIEKSGLKGQVGTSWVGKGSDATLGRLYKGEKANEEWQKWWTNAKRFGASESQFAKNIGDEKKSLQDKDASIEALRDILRKKNYEDPETFAAAQILLDKGKLSLDGMRDVYQKYAEISPRAAKAFGDKIAEKVNKQVEDGEITGAPNLNKALELMAQISGADKTTLAPLAAGETEQEREKRIVAFEQKTEIARDRIKELLKKAKKKDPNWAVERQILRQTYEEKDEKGNTQTKDYITVKNIGGEKLREAPERLPEGELGPTRPSITLEQQFEQGLEAAIAGLDNKALRELPRGLFEPKPENKVFINQLVKTLTRDEKRIGSILQGATPEQRDKIELWADVAKAQALSGDIPKLRAEIESVEQDLKMIDSEQREAQEAKQKLPPNAPKEEHEKVAQTIKNLGRQIKNHEKRLATKENLLRDAQKNLTELKTRLAEKGDSLSAVGITL